MFNTNKNNYYFAITYSEFVEYLSPILKSCPKSTIDHCFAIYHEYFVAYLHCHSLSCVF